MTRLRNICESPYYIYSCPTYKILVLEGGEASSEVAKFKQTQLKRKFSRRI